MSGMKTPTTCLSSDLTTMLLEWRNPQGADEKWIGKDEKRGDLLPFVGKVVTTEICGALLCVVATVECVVYGMFYFGSLGVLALFGEELETDFKALFDSSCFVFSWTLRTILVFNFSCINITTTEPLARYSMDRWPCGAIASNLLLAFEITVLLFGRTIGSQSMLTFTRDEDRLYIIDFVRTHKIDMEKAGIGKDIFIPLLLPNLGEKEVAQLLASTAPSVQP